MLTQEIDSDMLINSDSPYFYKSVSEDLFAMGQSLKQAMDAGVSPADFSKYEALSKAVATAQEVVLQLQDK